MGRMKNAQYQSICAILTQLTQQNNELLLQRGGKSLKYIIKQYDFDFEKSQDKLRLIISLNAHVIIVQRSSKIETSKQAYNINSDLQQDMDKLRKTLKSLIVQYNSFPYIIYNKIYLIPQRPLVPRFNYLINETNFRQAYEKHLPEKVDEEFNERYKNQVERRQLFKQYFIIANSKRQDYYEKVKKYYETVIYPLKKKSLTNSALLYYKNQKDFFNNYWAKKDAKYNLADIYNVFNDLPVEKKKYYDDLAKKQLQQNLQKSVAVEQEYLIPDIKKVLPHILYLQKTHGLAQRKKYDQFKHIPEEHKRYYKEQALQINKQKYEKLLVFLRKKDVSIKQFKQIQQVCQSLQQAKKHLRKLKKLELYQAKTTQGNKNSEDDISWQQLAQMNKALGDIDKGQDILMQSHHQNDVKVEENLIGKEQDKETLQHFTQNMDLDIEDKEIDIVSIRKKAKEVKKTQVKAKRQ